MWQPHQGEEILRTESQPRLNIPLDIAAGCSDNFVELRTDPFNKTLFGSGVMPVRIRLIQLSHLMYRARENNALCGGETTAELVANYIRDAEPDARTEGGISSEVPFSIMAREVGWMWFETASLLNHRSQFALQPRHRVNSLARECLDVGSLGYLYVAMA